MSSVLVTGADGFLGRHLVPALEAVGHEVVPLTRVHGDVADAGTWARLPAAERVVHLAARNFVPDSWRAPADFVQTNVLGATRALEYCRTHGAAIVHLSSYLYGMPTQLPIPESAPLVSWNPYALSKRLAEEASRFFAASLGVAVTVLRPFNVYGPGQREPFLVPRLVRQLREGGPIRVTDLRPRRDFVHVVDVVDGIVRAVGTAAAGFRAFNLGSGRSHSVADVIALLQRSAGTSFPVVVDGTPRQDEVLDTVADIGAARRELAWEPRVSLQDGLADLLRRTPDTEAA